MKAQLIFAAALLSLSATANAEPILSAQIHEILVEVCVNTQNDDKFGLSRTFRESRLSRQTAVEKVVCNGQPLMDFARSSEAHKVVAMLAPYERRAKVSISDVVAP